MHYLYKPRPYSDLYEFMTRYLILFNKTLLAYLFFIVQFSSRDSERVNRFGAWFELAFPTTEPRHVTYHIDMMIR